MLIIMCLWVKVPMDTVWEPLPPPHLLSMLIELNLIIMQINILIYSQRKSLSITQLISNNQQYQIQQIKIKMLLMCQQIL